MSLQSHKKKSVLLLRARSFFGANIVNLPTIYYTKKHLHSDQIFVFSDINLQSFYAQIPWVTEQYETQTFFGTWRKIPKNTTLLYSMRPSMDSAPFLKWLNRIPTAIGLSLRSPLLNQLFDQDHPCDPLKYRAIAHIEPLLIYNKDPHPAHYYLRQSMLSLAVAPQPENSICLMPGAGGGEQKKWGIKNFFELALRIQDTFPKMKFHFIVGHNEWEEKEFLSLQLHSALNFSIQENLDLSALTTLIESSVLTIANDCGPSHISQCLMKPFIGLYKEPNPEWFHAHTQSICLHPTNSSIQSIPQKQVLAACLQLLDTQTISSTFINTKSKS